MAGFFNQNERGIEGVTGKVGSAVKTVVKTAVNQVSPTSQDIINQISGTSEPEKDQDDDQGIEGMGQAAGKTKAAMKGQTQARNPAQQQAAARRLQMAQKGYKQEEIEKIESLRKKLHDEYFQELIQPKKKQEEEERPADKEEREEEEKKKKEQQKQQEEVKKKEDMKVVQERTKAERRPGAG